MKAYNKKNKPNHTTKSKYKIHFFKDVFWVRYIVKFTKKSSVLSVNLRKRHLNKKRFRKQSVHISTRLFWYLNFKDKFINKFEQRKFKD